MERKQEQDSTDRFNFCAYEANGPMYYDDFLLDRSYIIKALNDLKPNLATPNLTGGIFVGLTNIIETFKLVGSKCFRMIVLMDQGTSLKNSTFILQSILDQVRDFPFFIDFVRVNTSEVPQEDLELIKFAAKNNGAVYFTKNRSEIPKVIDTLLKKKEVHGDGDKIPIPPEKEPFFDNLGADLWIADAEGWEVKACGICRSLERDKVMCPQCRAVAHSDCLAQWAKMSNIGMPNIFRCMSCFRLLRLPKDFVLEVQSGEYKKKLQIQQANQAEVLRQREKARNPALVQTADQFANMPSPEAMGDEDFSFKKNDSDLRIQFCSCGAMNMPEAVKCAQCGKKL
jgi:hypothetical protein